MLLPFFYLFDLHLIIYGYLKNEPCYRWRPASYWRARIQSAYRWRRHSDEWLTRVTLIVLDKINIHPTADDPIPVGDGSAVLVLLFLARDSDLAHNSDADVRGYAVGLLGSLDPSDERAIVPIIEALSSYDMGVRSAALRALQPFGPKARDAVPKILPMLKNDYSGEARHTLDIIDPDGLERFRLNAANGQEK